jgi:hypothetical protein
MCACMCLHVCSTARVCAPCLCVMSLGQVPRGQEQQLVPFLSNLEARAAALGLTDIQLSLTSLVSWRMLYILSYPHTTAVPDRYYHCCCA